ncbi:MAG TPA: cell division protein SepF [Abditibacteriaceae bacterium]|nr:cell division protein SepF [Abditibacteriaceae bacterium]
MGAFSLRNIKNIWGQGDEADYEPEETEAPGAAEEPAYRSDTYRSEKYTSSPSSYTSPGSYASDAGGGSSGGAARRLRPIAVPLRSREKNIYTLKPKSQEEASIAADYLKTGSAVVLNLEAVDRVNAVRIIDFMSGVCYGLDAQGHAMKLGEAIFLFTPGEFELSSDETDYGENREFFFRELSEPAAGTHGATASEMPSPGGASATGSGTSYHSAERRSWER